MKNFKVMMLATLVLGGFALQALPYCPFTLINRTDGVIHANIGTQAATISESVSPFGYKTLRPGESSCFLMGRRFNKENKLYIRYVDQVNRGGRVVAVREINEFEINKPEIDHVLTKGVDYSQVMVIGTKGVVGSGETMRLLFFGKVEAAVSIPPSSEEEVEGELVEMLEAIGPQEIAKLKKQKYVESRVYLGDKGKS